MSARPGSMSAHQPINVRDPGSALTYCTFEEVSDQIYQHLDLFGLHQRCSKFSRHPADSRVGVGVVGVAGVGVVGVAGVGSG